MCFDFMEIVDLLCQTRGEFCRHANIKFITKNKLNSGVGRVVFDTQII